LIEQRKGASVISILNLIVVIHAHSHDILIFLDDCFGQKPAILLVILNTNQLNCFSLPMLVLNNDSEG